VLSPNLHYFEAGLASLVFKPVFIITLVVMWKKLIRSLALLVNDLLNNFRGVETHAKMKGYHVGQGSTPLDQRGDVC